MFQNGDIIDDRYRLDTLLGTGGFGVVYRATRLDTGEEVALKILHDHAIQDAKNTERFYREAVVIQSLTHPAVVEILGFGQTQRGNLYMALELLRGKPLDEVLEAGRVFALEETVSLLAQTLSALFDAHARGIVHRDIKPSNIFLLDTPDNSIALKLLDFGIAKETEGSDANEILTQTGAILGTPAYLAPEQAEGKKIGPYTDIYAFGLVAAEVFTGQRVIQASGLQACFIHASPEPIPLPTALLSSPLGPIIQRATEKDPKNRYQDAQACLDDLTSTFPQLVSNARDSFASLPTSLNAERTQLELDLIYPQGSSASLQSATPPQLPPADHTQPPEETHSAPSSTAHPASSPPTSPPFNTTKAPPKKPNTTLYKIALFLIIGLLPFLACLLAGLFGFYMYAQDAPKLEKRAYRSKTLTSEKRTKKSKKSKKTKSKTSKDDVTFVPRNTLANTTSDDVEERLQDAEIPFVIQSQSTTNNDMGSGTVTVQQSVYTISTGTHENCTVMYMSTNHPITLTHVCDPKTQAPTTVLRCSGDVALRFICNASSEASEELAQALRF